MSILLSLAVALTACRHEQSPQATAGDLSAAEYDLLSAFIAGKVTGGPGIEPLPKEIVKFVISSTTASADHEISTYENGLSVPWEKISDSLHRQAPTLQQSTIDSFLKVNTRQAFLRRSFPSPIDYELINSNQLAAIFNKNVVDGWQIYYKLFPGSQGIATFSRPGFSQDGTQAVFYFSNECGGMCGTGEYIVMEKRNGRWIIAKEITMWIS